MQNIITMLHHLKNVNQHEQPQTISKMANTLANRIRPALNNADTQALIVINARNWAGTTMDILKRHYLNALNIEKDKLTPIIGYNWRSSFFIASNWAKKKFGTKMTFDTLQLAESHIASLMMTPKGHNERAVPPGPSDDAGTTKPVSASQKPQAMVEIGGEFPPPACLAPAVLMTPQSSSTHAEASCSAPVTQDDRRRRERRRPVSDLRPWNIGPRAPQVQSATCGSPPPTCRRPETERTRRLSAERIVPPDHSSRTPVGVQPATEVGAVTWRFPTDGLIRWFQRWTGLSHNPHISEMMVVKVPARTWEKQKERSTLEFPESVRKTIVVKGPARTRTMRCRRPKKAKNKKRK
ncbi:uncharacterized protein LOC133646112 [Entelurus aequoreus]|uniref:uncharacterized protein LOC133646112 n=1 Tax=Entelurus aequoreus TaxID=161455 RepID=UPI002B1E1369|nr:uncharacterized protein LOC133646112 [Entelurus aequoreus]